MKKILLILALLCVSLQAQTYQFESAATGSGGISTATARQNTGWTASGTLARDTLYTNYAIFGAKTFGVGGTTQAQNARAKFNVLGRAANDTLLVFSNDGGGVVGDSAWTLLPNGHWNFGTGTNTAMIDLPASPTNEILWALRAAGAPRILLGRDASSQYGTFSYDGTNTSIVNANTGGNILLNSFGGLRVSASGGQAIIAATSTKGMQGFFTVNANGTTDSLAVFRNDKNATLDSTAIILKDGSFVTGEWRIRSGADSLVFHHDGVPVFAILPDGTTADLVAGVPPTLWRNGPPQEYIWLLRIGVLLLLLLVASKVYDYAKPRIRKHKTLPGEM